MIRIILVIAVLLVLGCSEGGNPFKIEDKSKRPVGMSDEIWKIYGGAESGVMEDKPKDTPPAQDKPPPEKK